MNKRILVIDDEEMIRNVSKRILEKLNYTVITTGVGRTAIELLAQDSGSTGPPPFDLMITDLKMPGMTGIELIQQVKIVRPRIRIIIITGSISPETKAEALALGVKYYVLKPFTIIELTTTVARCLTDPEAGGD